MPVKTIVMVRVINVPFIFEDPAFDFVRGIVRIPASNDVGTYEFKISTKTLDDVFGLPELSPNRVLSLYLKHREKIFAAIQLAFEDNRFTITDSDFDH